MNLKNLLTKFGLIALLVVFFAGSTNAQTTYYVDVVNGLDGYNGLTPNVLGAGQGPKQTIANAVAAAADGDIISVAYANGNLYNENLTLTFGVGTEKVLTFTSTGGTPNVVSLTVNNTAAAPKDITTFSGPFTFTSGLTLTAGKVIGATNITVGGAVTRTAGTVDGQLNFTGTVNFTYNGGAAVTSGGELPASANTTNFGNLTTTGATPLTLNESKTLKGIINLASTLNLSGGTLTINGANAHVFAVGGHVTNGTMAFDMGTAGNASTNAAAYNLPNVTATGSTALRTLTLNNTGTIGNISASGKAAVTVPSATAVGAVSNSGDQAVTLGAAATIGSLNNSSTGNIVVNTAAATTVTNDIMQSGNGFINMNVGTSLAVGGAVGNNPSFTLTNAVVGAGANLGVIIFADVPVTVTGQVSVSSTYAGTTGNTPTNWTNTGEIRFNNTTTLVTLTGGLNISSSHSVAYGGTAGAIVSNNGGVTFLNTTGNILIPGGVTVATTWPAVTGIAMANNGDFTATARTSGTLGAVGNPVGPINVTSSATNGANGNFITAATTNAGFTGSSLTTSGAAGGFIQLANESVTLSGNVVNSRTSAANHIQFGAAATAGVSLQIGGNLENSGASSIVLTSFNGAGAETISVTGSVKSSGTGSIAVNPLATLNGTGTITFGGIELVSGTVDLTGTAASNIDVLINGNATFTGGTFDAQGAAAVATVITAATITPAAADRVLQLGGLINNFGSATGSTNFATNTNTLLYVSPTSVVAAQTLTGNSAQTVWPSTMLVGNPTGLQPAVTFSGGNFRVLGSLVFDRSQVKVNNITVFIGGQLAPNIGTGNFYNHSGFVTEGNGFVSMNNALAGGTFGGAGSFENFEVDCAVSVTAAAATGIFKKTFNLTNGNVLTSNNINFNNSVDYPTIVRNAGTFAVAPTFTSMVNVYYIGLDKATANELPAATNKLNNLTVATTQDGTAPIVSGRGAVTVGVATTVNGKLEIFPNQTLVISGVDLTMAGSEIVLNGDITNVAAADELVLGRTAGTTITGSGWLPDLRIAIGSSGNVIEGAKGLVTNFLGTDNSRGGAAGAIDFDPTTAVASGSIVYGAGTGTLTVSFGSGALNGTHFTNLTTAHANNMFTLGANAAAAGNLTHPAGGIDVATFKLTFRGTTHALTSGATIVGAGTLEFIPGALATLTVNTNTATIAANVAVNTTTANFQLANGGQDLIVSGNLALTGTANSFDIGAGRTLTAAGYDVTLANGTSFIATLGGATGILKLDKAASDSVQTLAATGAVGIANLTVADDVKLNITGAGAAVTVNTAFLHTAGNLDFGNFNLTITGTYNRTGGTYTAGTGYLVINNATFNQGATAFSIPNLRFTANAAAAAAGQTGVVTVTGNLDLNNGGTIDISSANTGNATILNLADGATIIYTTGLSRFDVAPTFAGSVNITTANGAGAPVIHSTVWPAGLSVTKLTINNVAAGNTVELPGDRSVQDEIDLRVGVLDLGTAANVTLTLANSTVRRRDNGSIALNGGSLVYTNPVDLYYESTGGAIAAGVEVISPLNTLTVTRTGNVVNSTVTFAAPFTVNMDMTIRNNMTANANITLLGNLNISTDANALATAPIVTMGAANTLSLSGAAAQTIQVPSGVTGFGALNINNPNGVWLDGGNLNLAGTLTLTDGLFYTGEDNYVQLLNTAGPGGTQGYVKVAGSMSHVVGNVRKNLKTGSNPGFGRSEFPTGSETTYRPVAMTIVDPVAGNAAMGIFVTVNNEDGKPTGIVGLPIKNGIEEGIDIARYPDFYWNISSSSSLGNTVFDLELSTENFTDFSNVTNVRMIRRIGSVDDKDNQWLLQGEADSYDNFVASGVVSIVNVGSVGGVRPQGAIFTYGMKTRLSASELPDLTINQGEAYKVAVPLTGIFAGSQGELEYSASSVNEAVATVEVDGDTLWVTGVGDGQAEISVRATDINQDFLTVTFTVSTNPVGVEELGIPTDFALEQNYPNPFNPTTVIRFGLPEQSNVTLRVYNILGQEVATLLNTVKAAGWHEVNFNASQLGSGLYIYRIEAKDFVSIKKMMLVK